MLGRSRVPGSTVPLKMWERSDVLAVFADSFRQADPFEKSRFDSLLLRSLAGLLDPGREVALPERADADWPAAPLPELTDREFMGGF